ncbi:MAG: PAS domain S-box protein [Candidatus Riflebacteria bacterium]|nr:PAS domain S-box protein [Candidatus Riflebacteria bacterium]
MFVDSLLRAIPVAVFYKDKEGRYLGCNDVFAQIQGVTNEQIRGKTVYDLWPGDLAEKYHQADLELMNSPQHQIYEFEVKDKCGNFRPVIFGKQPFYDQHGQIAGLVGAFVDISAQKNLEKRQYWYVVTLSAVMIIQLLLIIALVKVLLARKKILGSLLQSEKKYKRLAQNLSAVVFQFKMAADGSCSFPFINDTLFIVTGIKAEDAMRDVNMLLDKIEPDERKAFQDSVVESARTLKPFHCIFRYTNRGNLNWVEARSTPERMSDGSTIWDGFFFDISEQKITEAALREKTSELETFFSSALDLLCIADTQGNFIKVNKEWERVLGYSVEELQNRKFLEFVHPDDMPATTNALAKLAQQETVTNFTNRFKCRDGNYHFLEWRSSPGGSIIYAAARDITERKIALDVLKESENRAVLQRGAIAAIMVDEVVSSGNADSAFRRITEVLADTLDASRSSVWALAADGRFVCQTLFSLENRQFSSGETFESAVFPTYFKAINSDSHVCADDALTNRNTLDLVDLYLKPNDIRSLLDAGIFIDGRLRGIISCEQTGHPRKWNSDEEAFICAFAAFAGQIMVAAERRQAEKSLRESEARLSKILAIVPDMVSVHDRQMNIVYSNWNGFGAVAENMRKTGSKCFKAYRGCDDVCEGCLAKSVFESGKPCISESQLADGRWIELRVLPIIDGDGDCDLFVEWVRDITSRKQTEQVIAAKNKELEQLLYVASHDLRSPLVNVDGYSREISFALDELQNALSEESVAGNDVHLETILSDINESLAHIRKSARQMDALLKGLLKLSRLGRAALNIGVIDMNRLVNEIVAANDFEAGKTGVDLQIESLPPCIGDCVQVTQVFSNLIGNAIKYLDSGRKGMIRVSGRVRDGKSIYCVEDNGIGIAPQHKDKIFELFHRLEPAKTEGEGLGLTIVRQVLEMLNGEISLDSTPGVGSCFRVTLPSAIEGSKS